MGYTKEKTEERKMEKMIFCQSCGMPLMKEEDFAKNPDGGKNTDYCQYCFAGGKFTTDETMEEMIESCIPHCLGGNPWNNEEEARSAMMEIFPKLKRWQK